MKLKAWFRIFALLCLFIVLTVALILLTAEISFAESIKKEEFYPYTNWLLLGRSSLGNIHAINLDDLSENVNTNNSVKKVWGKIIYSEKGKEEKIQKMREEEISVKGYENLDYSLDLFKIDCQNKTIGIVSNVDYDKNGVVLNSFTIPEILVKMRPVVPGSMIEKVFNIACAPLEDIQKLKACVDLYLTPEEKLKPGCVTLVVKYVPDIYLLLLPEETQTGEAPKVEAPLPAIKAPTSKSKSSKSKH